MHKTPERVLPIAAPGEITQLLRKVRNGDHQALEELWRRHEQRPQCFGPLPDAEFRPDVSGGDDSPREEAESDAEKKRELRLHKFLLLRFQRLRAAGDRSLVVN